MNSWFYFACVHGIYFTHQTALISTHKFSLLLFQFCPWSCWWGCEQVAAWGLVPSWGYTMTATKQGCCYKNVYLLNVLCLELLSEIIPRYSSMLWCIQKCSTLIQCSPQALHMGGSPHISAVCRGMGWLFGLACVCLEQVLIGRDDWSQHGTDLWLINNHCREPDTLKGKQKNKQLKPSVLTFAWELGCSYSWLCLFLGHTGGAEGAS